MKIIREKIASRLNEIHPEIRTKVIHISLLFLISSVVFFRLGKSSLLDYDEGIHAQVAKEIIISNDWLTLHFGGIPRFEKPPLYNWTTALFFKMFGVNEFWARAGSAISGILVVTTVYILGTAVYGRRVGFWAVLPLMTGYEFLRQARNGTTDVMLTLFMLITLTAYTKSSNKTGLQWYLIWISFALGFMVKFWAALIVIIAIGISIIFERKVKTTLHCKHFWGGLLVALVLILPWHIAMYQLHGQVFVDRYLLHNLLTRSANSLEGNIGTTRYYFDRMAYDYSVWYLLLPVALTIEVTRNLHARDRSRVLLVFAGCIFAIYSLLVDTKIFHYLTPIYPVLAIFNANVIIRAYDNYRSTAFSGLVVATFVAIIIPSAKLIGIFFLLVGCLIAVLLLIRFVNKKVQFSDISFSQVKPTIVKVMISVITRLLSQLGAIVERQYFPKICVVIMCLFISFIGISRSRSLYTIIESPVEQIATVAGASAVDRDKTIIALALPPDYDNAIVGPAAMFYSNRPIEVAWTIDKLAFFTSEGSREIIMGEDFINLLANEYEFNIITRRSQFIYGIIQQRK